ncbi:MAG TPA: hypothetical protein VK912_14465 [Longimicrobiales bacterium]|nr:hypothetical protein [Longimicrobiales bacterium]
MSHLNLETIARLVEDEPDTTEAAHLSACAKCRTQLEAMTEDVHALAMLPDMAVVPDQWAALERRLTEEGLIQRPHRPGSAWMMQAAAALLLLLGGALAGRMTAPGAAPRTAAVPTETRDAVQPGLDAPPAVLATDTEGQRAEDATPALRPETTPRSVTLASDQGMTLPQNATMDEAAEYLRGAEAAYLEALTRYAELASQAQSGDPIARLAALQSIILTTQAALNETPTDPVINGYHLTALAQRDATLRQVAQASREQWY